MTQRDHFLDRLDATQNRRVIPIAKHPANRRTGLWGQLLAQEYRDRTRQEVRMIPTATFHV